MPDEFEQELLTDIEEADVLGEYELAAEWRLELSSYRAAREQAEREDEVRPGSTPAARREMLSSRRPTDP